MSNITKARIIQCIFFIACVTDLNAHYFSLRKKNRLKHNPIVALYATNKIKKSHTKA